MSALYVPPGGRKPNGNDTVSGIRPTPNAPFAQPELGAPSQRLKEALAKRVEETFSKLNIDALATEVHAHSALLSTLLAPEARPTAPTKFAAGLIARWRLNEHDSCKLLGLEESQAPRLRAIVNGRLPLLGVDVRERVRIILRIYFI